MSIAECPLLTKSGPVCDIGRLSGEKRRSHWVARNARLTILLVAIMPFVFSGADKHHER